MRVGLAGSDDVEEPDNNRVDPTELMENSGRISPPAASSTHKYRLDRCRRRFPDAAVSLRLYTAAVDANTNFGRFAIRVQQVDGTSDVDADGVPGAASASRNVVNRRQMEYEGGRKHADQCRHMAAESRKSARCSVIRARSTALIRCSPLARLSNNVQFRGRIARKSLDQCPTDISSATCDEDSHSKASFDVP